MTRPDDGCLCCGHDHTKNGPDGRFRKTDPVQRFWSKVRVSDGCWEWQASKDLRGYGQFWDGKKFGRAHRYSYQLHFGSITSEEFVLHRCDNRICVRPDHLFLGTANDNIQDMVQKGRNCQGERTPWSKLKEGDIRNIRALARDGITHKEIARRFGIAKSGVGRIVQGLIWKGVTDEVES